MKRAIAIVALGALSTIAPVQSQEPASFQAWTSKHQTTQGAYRPYRGHQQKPMRGYSNRPVSLHQAVERLQRLERKQARLEQDMRRAQRYHASRSQIRSLRERLQRVNRKLHVAKRDYRHFLKRKLGSQHYQIMLNHIAWLTDNKSPQKVQALHTRPNRWRD